MRVGHDGSLQVAGQHVTGAGDHECATREVQRQVRAVTGPRAGRGEGTHVLGDALQADAELTTAIGSRLLLSARYGVMHQFERDTVPATLTHLLIVGVVARYSSTGKLKRPLPSQGKRVDQTDATPMNDAPPPSETAP